jgi:hypothetical protein
MQPDEPMEPMLQFFHYGHLREGLQTISKPFGDMIKWMCETLPRNPERTVALARVARGEGLRGARACTFEGLDGC